MSSYLRQLAIGIGFQIDTGQLGAADQLTDQFKANALSAESNVLQLGSAVTSTGSLAAVGMGAAASATSELGSQVEDTKGAFSGLKSWGSNAIDTVKTKIAESKEQIVELGETLKKSRVVIGAVFGISAALMGSAISTAADFEASMSRVGALSGATTAEMRMLTDQARELGATTVFSASQAAEGMQYLAMAGFSVQDTMAAMPGLLDTAAAAQQDLGTTADIVSNVLTGFNLQAGETGRVADVLTAAFTSSNTTLSSLGESMKMVAPIAAGLGVSIEETAALVGSLGNMGIQGTMAGTALRTILTSLANPTGEAAAQMQKLGVTTVDTAGNLLPLTSILDQLATKTAHMGDAQRTAFLESIAGRQGVTALTALLELGADSIDDYTHSLINSAGVAKNVAARQMDNLQGSIIQLKSALEGARITIGTVFIPVIRFATNVLTGIVTIFNKMPRPIQTVIAVGISAVTMISGLALAASFLIPKLGAISAGFGLLKTGFAAMTAFGAKAGAALLASFWPIVLGAAAVAAAVLLVQDIIMGLRGEGDTLTGRAIAWGKEIGPKLSAKIGQFSGALKVAGAVLGLVFGPKLVYTGALAAVQFGGSIAKAGVSLISFAGQGAKATFGMAKLGAQLLITGAKQAAAFVVGIAKAGIALGGKLLMGLLGATKAAIGFNVALLANPITWIVLGVVGLGAALFGLAKNWDKVKEWGGKAWASIKESVGGAITNIGSRLRSGWETTKTWAANVGDRVANVGARFREHLGSAGEWARSAAQRFKENPLGFVIDWTPFGLLKRGTESLLGWFGDWLQERGISLPELSIPAFPDMIAWAKSPLESLDNWLAEKGFSLPDFSLPSFPDLISWAKAPIDTFTEWISEFDIGTVIGDAIGSAWDWVTSPLEEFTGKIREWLPFSPAKEGPLSDLDKVGFGLVDTVASSISKAGASGAVGDALNSALALDPYTGASLGEVPMPAAGGFGRFSGGPAIHIEVNVDARGATAEDAEAIGQTTASSLREMLEAWVEESALSAALEEV